MAVQMACVALMSFDHFSKVGLPQAGHLTGGY